jgi:hypothetical protein
MAAVAPVVTSVAPAVVADHKNAKCLHVSGIPDSRLRTGFDEDYINPTLTKKINEIKAKIDPFKRARKALEDKKEQQFKADGKPLLNDKKENTFVELTEARTTELKTLLETNAALINQLEEEHDALSAAKIRFSSDSMKVLRDVCVVIIDQLLEHSLANCRVVEDKMIQVHHAHSKGVEQLPIYPLICNLPSWKSTRRPQPQPLPLEQSLHRPQLNPKFMMPMRSLIGTLYITLPKCVLQRLALRF